MGLNFSRSRSSYDIPTECRTTNQNPDPLNYTLIKSDDVNSYLIVMIKYHGCSNYEGKKILVYKDISLIDLVNQKSIDPHFSNSKKFHSPIARFVPTDDGYKMAIKFCEVN